MRVRAFQHPNVPQLFEFGHDGETCFVTMELLDGETLRSVLSHLRPERLEPSEVDRIVTAIGDVLVKAHDCGIVHGDVRPETILVTTDQDIKLLNFECTALTMRGPIVLAPSEEARAFALLVYELYAGGRAHDELTGRDLRRLPRRRARAVRHALLEPRRRPLQVREFLVDAGLSSAGGVRRAEPGLEQAPLAPERQLVPLRAVVLFLALAAGGAAYLGGGSGLLEDIVSADSSASRLFDGDETSSTPSTPSTVVPARGESTPHPDDTTLGAVGGEENQGGELLAAAAGLSGNQVVGDSRMGRGPGMFETGAAMFERTSVEPGSARREPDSVSFATRILTAYENQTPLAVEVYRTGEIGRAFEFTWRTRDGTARDGDDYARLEHRETFAPGERTRTLFIPIAADNLPEDDEQFFVELNFDSDNADTKTVIEMPVVLIDDDL
jgi:hypothetical protein